MYLSGLIECVSKTTNHESRFTLCMNDIRLNITAGKQEKTELNDLNYMRIK